MATHRKKRGDELPDATRAFSVVVEEMRGHFRVFGERLGSLRDQVTTLGAGLASLDDRVARLDDRVATLDEKVTTGFARVDQDIGLLKIAVLDINRQLKNKVDRDEVEPIVERVPARAAR